MGKKKRGTHAQFDDTKNVDAGKKTDGRSNPFRDKNQDTYVYMYETAEGVGDGEEEKTAAAVC